MPSLFSVCTARSNVEWPTNQVGLCCWVFDSWWDACGACYGCDWYNLDSWAYVKYYHIFHCVFLFCGVLGRWVHPASGRSYHTRFHPPQVAGKDDVCILLFPVYSRDFFRFLTNVLCCFFYYFLICRWYFLGRLYLLDFNLVLTDDRRCADSTQRWQRGYFAQTFGRFPYSN